MTTTAEVREWLRAFDFLGKERVMGPWQVWEITDLFDISEGYARLLIAGEGIRYDRNHDAGRRRG